MTTEFAGAIEIDPPLRDQEIDHVRRLAQEAPETMPWSVSRDGTVLQPRGPADVATAQAALRLLVGSVPLPSRLLGSVALYDPDARELVVLTVSNGRVTRRSLRRCRPETSGSNVVDLAGRRRRSASRAIG